MIERGTSVESAKEMKTIEHMRLKLVVDLGRTVQGSNQWFRPVVRESDAGQGKIGLPLNELLVKEIMIHRDALHAIEIRQFCHATIGDVLLTMEASGDQYVLVFDNSDKAIRGLIPSSEIARALHTSVSFNGRAHSFSDFYQAVRG